MISAKALKIPHQWAFLPAQLSFTPVPSIDIVHATPLP